MRKLATRLKDEGAHAQSVRLASLVEEADREGRRFLALLKELDGERDFDPRDHQEMTHEQLAAIIRAMRKAYASLSSVRDYIQVVVGKR